MPPENHTTTDFSYLNSVSTPYEQVDQSGGSWILSDRVVGGEEVLASSSDSPHFHDFHQAFHQFWDESHVGDALQAAIGSHHGVPKRQDQREYSFPEGIPDHWNNSSVSLFEPQPVFEIPRDTLNHLALADSSGCFFIGYSFAEQLVAESSAWTRLESALHASFETDPLEDGMSHPAEVILGQALRTREGPSILIWLREICLNSAQPSFAASIFRCVGRLTVPGADVWRAGLVRDGLAMNDLEIRDAAVQVAESWGDPGLYDVLKSHSEPVAWLRDYIFDVIDDLRN